jgi:hypothetical protein
MTDKRQGKKKVASRLPRGAGLLRVVRTPRPVGAVTKELGETHKGLARTQMNMLRLVPGVGGLPPPPVLKAVVQGDTGPRRPVRRAVVAAPKSRATVASKHGFPQAPLSSLRLDPPFASDIADAGDRLICRVEMPGVQSEDVEVVCFVDAILLHVTRRPQAAEPVRRSGPARPRPADHQQGDAPGRLARRGDAEGQPNGWPAERHRPVASLTHAPPPTPRAGGSRRGRRPGRRGCRRAR